MGGSRRHDVRRNGARRGAVRGGGAGGTEAARVHGDERTRRLSRETRDRCGARGRQGEHRLPRGRHGARAEGGTPLHAATVREVGHPLLRQRGAAERRRSARRAVRRVPFPGGLLRRAVVERVRGGRAAGESARPAVARLAGPARVRVPRHLPRQPGIAGRALREARAHERARWREPWRCVLFRPAELLPHVRLVPQRRQVHEGPSRMVLASQGASRGRPAERTALPDEPRGEGRSAQASPREH